MRNTSLAIRRVKKYWWLGRLYWLRVRRWWYMHDRRWGLWWRTGNGLAVLVILLGIVTPVAQQLFQSDLYKLSADSLSLVGKTDSALAQQLVYNPSTQTYEFNQSATKTADNPLAAMQAKVGAASGKGKDKSLYGLDVPADFSKGVKYHDVNTGLSFSLVPQFRGSGGKMVGGHLVYPLAGGNQAVYTLKNNGLKEDIVVQKASEDSMTFSYKLDLPKTLVARALPDKSGGIGIYSADPTLYGNISYGDNADKKSVQNARVKGKKDHLVFGLPAPVIKSTKGNSVGSARFVLQGNSLQVVASDLLGIKGSFTIDPSVVVTSASDFATGNNEGNISFDTGGISRGGLTGGSLSGGWSTTAGLWGSYESLASVAYNGYLYVLGGDNGTNYYNQVRYAQLTANGTIASDSGCGSAWCATSGFSGNRDGLAAATYNGYIYIMGGWDGSTRKNDTQYAKVTSTGAIASDSGCGSAWCTSPKSFTGLRNALTATAYNGYLYVSGGWNGSTTLGDIQYAPIKANGDIGDWATSTNTYERPREGIGFVAYNGYMYMTGGYDSTGSGYHKDVQFASINSDGSLGTWQYTCNGGSSAGFTCGFPGYRQFQGTEIYGGYMYVLGGDYSGYHNDVWYAPVNANGTLGTWQTTASFATSRTSMGTALYNGYIYVLGGWNGSAQSDVQYAQIDPAGVVGGYTTASQDMSSRLMASASVAYNGYLYLLGGSTSSSLASVTNNVYYTKLNSDGSTGTWNTTSVFGTARNGAAAVAYNGYMYIMGGWHPTSDTSCATVANQSCGDVQKAVINSDGTLGSWSSAGANFSSQPRQFLEAAMYNSHLYIFGGSYNNNANLSAETDVGQVQSNGNITGWTTTGSLTRGRSDFGIAQSGKYLYALGGRVDGSGATNYSNTIDYAVLSNSGSVTWATAANLFANGRSDLIAGASNGFVYISGGAYGSSTNVYNDTQYARICMGVSTADGCSGAVGTLGTWHTTTSFATARTGQAGTIYNGYLYMVGGCSNQGLFGNCSNSTNTLKDVQYAPINNGGDGAAGAWTTNLTGTYVRHYHSTVVYNGYMYIMGGEDSDGNGLNDVRYAAISPNGSVGSWSSTTSFTTGRWGFGAVIHNGYMYIMGGDSGNIFATATSLNDVQYAHINTDGTLGSWQYTYNSASSGTFVGGFATPRSMFGAVTYNGYIYVMGGIPILNDVQYAPINSNGTVGAWNTTTSFSTARYSLSAVVYNGYIYVLGGAIGGSPYYLNDVQYAPINSNGTVGAWNTTTSFSTARADFGAVVYDGYMYVVAGNDGTHLGDVQYAPINSNGALGGWGETTSTTDRSQFSIAVYKGYLYVLAGDGDSQAMVDIQYSSLSSIARTSDYSKLINLGSTVNVTGVSYNGTVPGGSAAITYRAAGSDGVFGATEQVSNISGAGGCVGNTQNTRYLFVSVTLDDSYGAGTGGVFPDFVGTNANLTDLVVNYNPVHPPPEIRLRLGQTLQSGELSPFDTCVGGSSVSLATVSTTAASSISNTSATSGGNVTDDGGASVTERGVVYSTSQNPTVSDTKVVSGSGTGSFTSNLTGLSSNITYYVRAYATNSAGVAYGSQVSFTTTNQTVYNIGDTGPGGGIVFYDKGSFSDGWQYMEVAPYGWYGGGNDPSAAWCSTATTTNATGLNVGTGKQNTTDILSGCADTGNAASLAHNYSGGGYSDWFLPSRSELSEIYQQRTVVGSALQNVAYWSSSEDTTSNAWFYNYSGGSQSSLGKTFSFRVHPIREF